MAVVAAVAVAECVTLIDNQSMRPCIGIVTFQSDMHAVAVANAIARLDPTVEVHVFEVDALDSSPGALFISGTNTEDAFLHDSNKNKVLLSTLSLVWWRRTTFPQRVSVGFTDDDAALINRDSQAFIEALFTLRVSGGWVNHPWHARRAESKPLQMLVAQEAGMSIPETVVTNDPTEVAKLVSAEGAYVVKSLAGLPGKSLLTQRLVPELITDPGSIEISPACYQRYIEGNQHIRILAFGTECIGAIYSSSQIDSRVDICSGHKCFDVPDGLKNSLHKVLRRLELAMGVFDLKVDMSGRYCFLEVNQQGQFLYLDAITDASLIEKFATFLLREAKEPKYSLIGICSRTLFQSTTNTFA